MEFNGLILLAALWFLLSLISKAQRKPQQGQRPRPHEPMRPRPLPTNPDATQVEGSRLELVLRELQRSLEQGSLPDWAEEPVAPEQHPAEAESLEVEPEVTSLEGEVRREARRRVDQDDEAADIEVRRIQAAAARDTGTARRARTAVDERIRQEPADHTAARTYTPQQLRDAVVWREILGPPVGLRGGEEGRRESGDG
jgi:hypothetical protein